ncbi:MAG: hypothetical protein J6U54_17950 [Clostridiales bacterium]|nr:hypothetical protein [Clostridiales bacterium]
MQLNVSAITDDSEDLFGKTVSDLQQDISVGRTGITGTLKYVDDYTGFSGDPSLQSGNYLALHCEVPDASDVSITVTVTNPSVLDPDGDIVLRIADKDTQTVTVVAVADGQTLRKTFSLRGLTVLDS